MEYRRVYEPEKRAELEAAGIPWPKCVCCGLDKRWKPRNDRPAGGSWQLRCSKNRLEQKYVQTPGTYKYNRNHGLGEVGEKDRAARRKRYATPGTYLYNKGMRVTKQRMQKYIEGTPENIEYKEKIRQQWQMKLNALS